MKYYVGIDVAKDKIDCLWLRDTETLKVKTKVLTNNPNGFNELKAWLKKNITESLEDIYISIEATGIYHEALAYALFNMGIKVNVANPATVRAFATGLGAHSKTDKKDSMVLARYAAMTSPQLWQPEPEEVRVLKALLARLSALEKDIQRELNRLEKAQISQASALVISSIESMVKKLREEKARIEKQVDDHIDKYPDLKSGKEDLLSIPGIGDVLSREMLSLLHSRPFKKASEVAAFVGVTPKLCESGKFKGKSVMNKRGSGKLRAKLYMAAIVAKQYNPDVKAQYERLLKAGKTKMQALGAAMRKLVHICFGVLKHQSRYQPQLVT